MTYHRANIRFYSGESLMNKQISLKEIRDILLAQLPELKKKYHVESLELFGSRTREENTPGSDIDILVSFSTPPSLLEFIRLKDSLSESLGIDVDLVMRDALKPNIAVQILEEAIPV